MWQIAIVDGVRYPETQWRDVHIGGRVYTRFRGAPGWNGPWTMVTVSLGSGNADHWWARAFR